MAQKIHVLLTDDLDGSAASQTVAFGWLGTNYEIDLNDKNYAAFEKAVAKYLAAARKVGRASAPTSGRKGAVRGTKRSAAASVDLAAVRAWARESGYEVSDRGRVSAAIVEAYHAAN